ncbi:iron complex transport system ATP-binding protein [Prauserella isguenensis]|uniref:Iron complex transport system ATP-binding protein n=1 Tax=Prauserella isguenensis TaxID=1470180 RepID=A0A839S608_9PSEU|nr:iron complex transport system ATP-binding protein [Prauserella isguenensis]
MSKLSTERITFAYEDSTVLEDLSVAMPEGRITSIIGPNGCGKSTLLGSMARLLKPRTGSVHLDGEVIANLATREVAKRLGVLPQGPHVPEGLTTRELVSQGRYPHQSFLRQWSRSDERAVARALEITGVDGFADRALDTLSGGQRQRAWIAMALAQQTDTLLLDEPTTYLDMAHQLEVLELLARLNREEGQTAVMVLHDLNSAARYSHQMIALCEGRVYAAGSPHEVMTSHMLGDVFGVKADIFYDPRNGSPQCLPYELLGRTS